MNELHLGNNLEIMKKMDDQSIDLIATDPPYFTQRDWKEYDDRWESLQDFIDFMELRILEFYRLLKPTGSMYIQCDYRTVHYLRVMIDNIFGYDNLRNDIIWCYAGRCPPLKYFPRKHDNILFYTKSDQYTFNTDATRIPYSAAYQNMYHKFKRSGEYTHNEIVARIMRGKAIEDYWIDINTVTVDKSHELREYPTQKPLELYERIISASSNKGDVVMDPFMGSGTTIEAARKLGRNYIGIDKNPKSIEIAEKRLSKYGNELF